MEDQTKVLDVSFGTFSCRLEGFDAPVETLQTVVSFLHDLVGHDSFVEKAPIVAVPAAGMPVADLTAVQQAVEHASGHDVSVTEDEHGLHFTAHPEADDAWDDDVEAEDAYDETAYEEEPEFTDEEPEEEEESLSEKLMRVRQMVKPDPEPEPEPEPEMYEDAAPEPATEPVKMDDGSVAPGNPLSQRLAAIAQRAAESRAAPAEEQPEVAPAAPAPDAISRLRSSIAASTTDSTPDEVAEEPAASATTEQPSGPSPLRLVPTQRTDLAKHEAAAMRLRQIATESAAEDDGAAISFEAFVAEHEAEELPELVEAAAAYVAFIEGEPEFSRPQITQKLQSVLDESVEREDILLTFGRLIRLGRIKKSANGRFTVAEDTPYRAPNSRAG